jgi:hypothetical protein
MEFGAVEATHLTGYSFVIDYSMHFVGYNLNFEDLALGEVLQSVVAAQVVITGGLLHGPAHCRGNREAVDCGWQRQSR